MKSRSISVYAQGMVTAVGCNAPSTCAAMRAGISGLQQDNLWDIHGGEYLTVGRPQVPQWWEGRDMLAELVAPAIGECLDSLRGLPPWSNLQATEIPVFLIVAPKYRPSRWPELEQRVLQDLTHKLGFSLQPRSRVIAGGRTGIVDALEQASICIEHADTPFCIVAGVESFLRQSLAEHYTRERRLKSDSNSNGFIPGEAAGALLIGRVHEASYPQLVITGVGQASDPAGAGGTQQSPATGQGLTAAVRQALEQAGHDYSMLDLRVTDLNGEHWKFKEAQFADGRLDRPRPSGQPQRRLDYLDLWHPAEFIGDVGAALFPIMLGWTHEAHCKHYAHGPRSLLFAMEDGGERAAVTTEFLEEP